MADEEVTNASDVEYKPVEQQTAEERPELPQAEAPAAATEAPATEAKPDGEEHGDKGAKTPKWATDRFGELTRQREDAKKEAAQLKAERDLYKAMAEGNKPSEAQAEVVEGTAPKAQPLNGLSQADLDALVTRRAAELSAQQAFKQKTDSLLSQGRAEFKDFDERCNLIAEIGGNDRADFLPLVTELPDSHKILAQMADNPAEARRILSAPGPLMAIELTKFAMNAAKPAPKQISSAPKPITPIDGTAKPNDELSEDDSDEAWFRKRQAQIDARKRAGQIAF